MRLLVVMLLTTFVSTPVIAQVTAKQKHDEHKAKRLRRASDRHKVLADLCVRKRLFAQAVEQYDRAYQVSEHRDIEARREASQVRSRAARASEPSASQLKWYAKEKEAREVLYRKDRFWIAESAWNARLEDEAMRHWKDLVAHSFSVGHAPRFTSKHVLKLDGGNIPSRAVKKHFLSLAIEINGERRLRDSFLADLKKVHKLYEHAAQGLSVRTEASRGQTRVLYDVAALMRRQLDDLFGHVPSGWLSVFVFAKKGSLEAYVRRKRLGPEVYGCFVDRKNAVLLTHGEKRSDRQLQDAVLRGLPTLFLDGCPCDWPAWYIEAVAGRPFVRSQGAKDTVELGTKPLLEELQKLAAAPRTRLVDLWTMTPVRLAIARRPHTHFSAESWCFLHYLRDGAGPAVARRLQGWERACRGAEVDPKRRFKRFNGAAAFDAEFGEDAAELEAGFAKWLAAQVGDSGEASGPSSR